MSAVYEVCNPGKSGVKLKQDGSTCIDISLGYGM
jgi:hypothetical protein